MFISKLHWVSKWANILKNNNNCKGLEECLAYNKDFMCLQNKIKIIKAKFHSPSGCKWFFLKG